MNRKEGLTLLGMVVIGGAIFLAGVFLSQVVLASDPNSTSRLRYVDRALIEGYRGGSETGYGAAHKLSVSTTAASTKTTDVSADGVYMLHFANTGTSPVYISLNGSTVTTANCNVIVPDNMTFTSYTKVPVDTVYYYCPSGSATLYLSY